VCLVVIAALVWLLWWHGDLDDQYHELPHQRYTTRHRETGGRPTVDPPTSTTGSVDDDDDGGGRDD